MVAAGGEFATGGICVDVVQVERISATASKRTYRVAMASLQAQWSVQTLALGQLSVQMWCFLSPAAWRVGQHSC